ncbi:MAG: cadherin-like beta sandwich domain-containing protein [Lachnospiraceae bacterium]|nr:cadherin-like beta sandwich domain-containing protein [Lachnospiraceae bacterium]
MRKKRFLAITAAIAISLAAPVTAFATEPGEVSNTIDDEQAEGEQTTIVEPDADSSGGSNSSSGGSSSGSSGGSTTGSGKGTSAASGGNGSGNTASSAGSAKSSDSSLAHLGISPGSLSPSFSAGTHEYTATVDAGVTAISVAARPNSSKAVIASVSGAKSLKPGTNTVKVVVEAESGAVSTYTITVNCGSATTSAQTTEQEDASSDAEASDSDAAPEGEISAIDDTAEVPTEEPAVTFDDNGYLIYEGNAYLPSSMMPEGEYVSLDKYNKLYDRLQAQKTKDMRILIILVVVIAMLLIVILNLVLKLRDMRQDAMFGPDGDDEEEEADEKLRTRERKARKEEQPVKPEKTLKAENPVKPEKPSKAEKPVKPEKSPKTEKPSKPAKSAKPADDLEILDLNDL